MMFVFVLSFTCLACAGHGRRVQFSLKRLPRSSAPGSQYSERTVETAPRLLECAEVDRSGKALSPIKSLTARILTLNVTVAFLVSSAGMLGTMNCHPASLDRRKHYGHQVTRMIDAPDDAASSFPDIVPLLVVGAVTQKVTEAGGPVNLLKESKGWFDGMPSSQYDTEIPEAEVARKELIEFNSQFGPRDPNTLGALHKYAMALSDAGRHDDAEPVMKTVLLCRRQDQGLEDADTLKALNDYSLVLKRLGRPNEAEPLMKGALDIRSRVLGPESPDTLKALTDYADTLVDLNRRTEAERLYMSVFDLSCRTLGLEDQETLRVLKKYAGENYDELLGTLRVKNILSADIPNFLSNEPNWTIFAERFHVADHTGVEVEGLDSNKQLFQLCQRIRKELIEFIANDTFHVIENRVIRVTDLNIDPTLGARWHAEVRVPLGQKYVPVDMAAEVHFHVNEECLVDSMRIDKLFLNERRFQLTPGVKLSDDPAAVLEKLRLWVLDIAEVLLLQILRVLSVVLSPGQ